MLTEPEAKRRLKKFSPLHCVVYESLKHRKQTAIALANTHNVHLNDMFRILSDLQDNFLVFYCGVPGRSDLSCDWRAAYLKSEASVDIW